MTVKPRFVSQQRKVDFFQVLLQLLPTFCDLAAFNFPKMQIIMRLNCYTTFRTGILLVAAFLLGQCLSAQPAPFYSETFADSLNFTTKWVYGGTNPGKEKWVWSKITGGLYQGQPAFGSKTAANGFIVFNSDENGEFAHDVTITSPVS